MKPFAKLFETEKYGQILVKIDRHEETQNPEVRIYATLPSLGVCSVAFQWEDNDNGWDLAEIAFEKIMIQSYVEALVAEMLKKAPGVKRRVNGQSIAR